MKFNLIKNQTSCISKNEDILYIYITTPRIKRSLKLKPEKDVLLIIKEQTNT